MVVDRLAQRIRTSGANPTISTKSPGWSWPSWSSHTKTGAIVTNNSALSLTAAYRGVSMLASLGAGLPLDVYEKGADGARVDVADESNAYIWRRPNPEMTRQEFLEVSIGQEILGNCFWWVEKDSLGLERYLWPMDSERLKVGRTKSGRKVYQLDNELPMIDFKDGGEVVHIPNFKLGGLLGLNPFKVGAEALAIGLSAQEYAARYYSDADSPPGFISSDQTLTEDQSEAISNLWHKLHSSLARLHRVAVLGNGAKFQTTGIDPETSQLHEARKFSVSEVGRLLGLLPAQLGDVDHAGQGGGNGVEEMNRTLTTYTLNAHLTRFELAYNDSLLVRELTGRYAKFNSSALLRGNTLARFQAYRAATFMTENEKRALEDLPPIAGGDKLLTQSQNIPLEDAGKALAQPAGGSASSGPQDENAAGA